MKFVQFAIVFITCIGVLMMIGAPTDCDITTEVIINISGLVITFAGILILTFLSKNPKE